MLVTKITPNMSQIFYMKLDDDDADISTNAASKANPDDGIQCRTISFYSAL